MTTQATQPDPLFASFVALMLDTLTGLLPGPEPRPEFAAQALPSVPVPFSSDHRHAVAVSK